MESLFHYFSYIIGVGAEDYDFPGVQTTQWQRGQPQQVVSFVDYDDDRDDDGDEEDENYDNDGDYDGADDSDDEEDENF